MRHSFPGLHVPDGPARPGRAVGLLGLSVAAMGAVAVCAALVSCARKVGPSQQGEEPMAGNSIQAVLQQHAPSLMSLSGVVGTGLGECGGTPCIKVFVVKKTPELGGKIPASLIRPMVFRRWANIHPLVTLVGALAGVPYFGILGLLIGPLALSYFFELVKMYREEYLRAGG